MPRPSNGFPLPFPTKAFPGVAPPQVTEQGPLQSQAAFAASPAYSSQACGSFQSNQTTAAAAPNPTKPNQGNSSEPNHSSSHSRPVEPMQWNMPTAWGWLEHACAGPGAAAPKPAASPPAAKGDLTMRAVQQGRLPLLLNRSSLLYQPLRCRREWPVGGLSACPGQVRGRGA